MPAAWGTRVAPLDGLLMTTSDACVLTPMARLQSSNRGPPLLPGLVGALCWIILSCWVCHAPEKIRPMTPSCTVGSCASLLRSAPPG